MFTVEELISATSGSLRNGVSEGTYLGPVNIDSRTIKRGEVFLAIKGKNFDGHSFMPEAIKRGASCIIGEKKKIPKIGFGKKVTIIEVDDTIRALGDLARFLRKRFNIPVVAVTGSNGKTTTKEMIASVLGQRYCVLKNEGTKNNHIGLPLTLLRLSKKYDIAVLEIGTNHFGEVSYLADICLPNIGVITNIGPSHLEAFGRLEGVYKEKTALLKKLINPRICILNADDIYLKRLLSSQQNGLIGFGFGINSSCDFSASRIKVAGSKLSFWLNNNKVRLQMNTVATHNVHNALIACAVGRIFGLDYSDIAKQLSDFRFPQGRLNLKRFKGILFLDDSYNSNPLSLEKALDTLKNIRVKGRKILVLGDMLELGKGARSFHIEAGQKAARVCSVVIGVGDMAKLALDEAERCGLDKRNIFSCANPSEARQILFKRVLLNKYDVVLVKGSRAIGLEEVFS